MQRQDVILMAMAKEDYSMGSGRDRGYLRPDDAADAQHLRDPNGPSRARAGAVPRNVFGPERTARLTQVGKALKELGSADGSGRQVRSKAALTGQIKS